ncbi:tRNA (N6-threonylcarbamoyladenosine(37)-N6)-methyltransferase TrmO, partial [Vibrio breoganii]
DSIPDALGGFAADEPEVLDVNFSQQAQSKLASHPQARHIIQVIKEVLGQDPRPAYKKGKPDNKEYAVNLFDLNVKFVVETLFINVTDIERF